jgi:heme-degrading monooxygenase HmoA
MLMGEQATGMPAKPEPKIVTVFRSRLRDQPDGYEETGDEMLALASAMPGFVDYKLFTADDGERVSLITFSSRAEHDAWRIHPQHASAQARGRAEWYAEYTIQVCELIDERRFAL